MTLKVHVYQGKSGTEGWKILPSEMGDALAGPEVSRKDLWGSYTLQSFELNILPILNFTDIYADGEKLIELESEVKMIRDKVSSIALKVPYDEYSILAIIKNILKAINRAKEIGGGIVIW